MRKILFAFVLIFGVALFGCARTAATPDFSGTWVLNVPKSSIPKFANIKSETIVIQDKKPAMTFDYDLNGETLTETYIPDGQTRVVKAESGMKLTSSANWRGSVLVIAYTIDMGTPDPATGAAAPSNSVVHTWTLSPDGRTLTRVTDDHKEVYVFEKQ